MYSVNVAVSWYCARLQTETLVSNDITRYTVEVLKEQSGQTNGSNAQVGALCFRTLNEKMQAGHNKHVIIIPVVVVSSLKIPNAE